MIHTQRLPEIQAMTADRQGSPSKPWTGNYCKIQGSNGWDYRTFLQYDLSSIPLGAPIISAKLKVYCTYWNDNGGSGTTNISRVTASWDEATLTWNNQPATTGTYLSANVNAPAIGTWSDWDITNLVTEWVSGTYPNYGLYIKNNNEGSYRVDWNISCHKTGDGNASYIEVTYDAKDSYYLIEDETTLYSLNTGELLSLNTKEATSSLFLEHGIMEYPTWEQISQLTNPTVLMWTNEIITDSLTPLMEVHMNATPLPQNVITNAIDLSDPTITGIELMTVNCEGNPLFAVSFDDKATWYAWNGTEWSLVSEEFSGMTKELLESVTYDYWMLLYEGASNFYIRATITTLEDKLTEVYVDFAN